MIRKLFITSLLVALTALPALSTAADQDTIMFNLGKHVKVLSDEPCSICHPADAHSITPPVSACLECHEQEMIDRVRFPAMKTHGPLWYENHGVLAKTGMYQCATCHEQGTCLDCHKAGFPDEQGENGNNFINIHRSDFQVTHPLFAKNKARDCETCHEVSFCSDCHDAFKDVPDLAFSSHKTGWQDLVGSHGNNRTCSDCHSSAIPNHEWRESHAREARRNLAVCQTCHPGGDTCQKCHSTMMEELNPHPADWNSKKDRLRDASNGRVCLKCHPAGDF